MAVGIRFVGLSVMTTCSLVDQYGILEDHLHFLSHSNSESGESMFVQNIATTYPPTHLPTRETTAQCCNPQDHNVSIIESCSGGSSKMLILLFVMALTS